VLATPQHARFARCIVQDLADVLGAPAVPLPEGGEHPLLGRGNAGPARILRNL
jgi:hypothetical protein